MSRKIIPFSWYPAHWGLKGKALEMAQAEFELEGVELRRKKIDININERTEDERNYQYAKSIIKVNINKMSEIDVKVALLDLKKEYKKRDEQEYEKEKATLLGEPWVVIKKLQTDPDDPRFGGVELDWNDEFVAKLELHGYGPNPEAEDTVNDWFNELCRNIALEAYAGVGDFEEAMGVERPEESRPSHLHEDVILVPTPKPKDSGDSELDNE
jgi:hypothetical protein